MDVFIENMLTKVLLCTYNMESKTVREAKIALTMRGGAIIV